jgi:hypothetical protein
VRRGLGGDRENSRLVPKVHSTNTLEQPFGFRSAMSRERFLSLPKFAVNGDFEQ